MLRSVILCEDWLLLTCSQIFGLSCFSLVQDEFARLPYNCAFFLTSQQHYEEYCQQRAVMPFLGFCTADDMRLFHCGFWLNFATLPRAGAGASAEHGGGFSAAAARSEAAPHHAGAHVSTSANGAPA